MAPARRYDAPDTPSAMAEQIFSGLMVATAVALLARLALGERGRARVARAWRDATRRFARSRPPPRLPAPAKTARAAPPAAATASPLDARDAARIADDAIRRARDTSATRRGNVITPSAFRATGSSGADPERDRRRDGDGDDGGGGSGRRDRKLH